MKYRKICFTLNNYSEDEYDSLKLHIINDCSYGVIGKEVGEQGTEHLQGYVEYKNPRSFKKLKEIYPRCHLEPKRGTNIQALEYCKKEGNFWEQGTTIPEEQGRRGDLQAISEHISDNNGIRDMIESKIITNYQHLNVSERLMKYFEGPRTEKPEVFWLYGPSGTGKTRDAMEYCQNPWLSNGSLQWFDSYDGQEDVIFDDFRPTDVEFHFLLRLLDRYPVNVPIKGAFRSFKPKRIFITTPYSIAKTYQWIGEDLQQLVRRVDKEIEYKKGEISHIGTKVTEGNTNTSETYG